MTDKIHVASAGNTLAPALAVLRELGFEVTRTGDGETELYRAENGACRLFAEDPLMLLGLATMVQHRGACWQPTDPEIEALLELSGDASRR
jgi:hypothetical protein